MRKLIVLVIILSSIFGYSQTTLECLNNYYIAANTLPQYITNRNFTGVRATPNGGTSVYLVTPVTYSVSGNFVSLRGNNGAIISVDSRTTTPSFANVNALLQWIGSCNSSLSNPTNSIEEIVYGTGMPTTIPTSQQARHFVDITGQEWYFNNFIWWFNGVAKQSAPPATQTVISGVTYNYTQGYWYNSSNNTYNRYLYSCNCWKSFMYSEDSSVVRTTGNQTIWGKKTFADTATFSKTAILQAGLKSYGTIDAKKGVISDSLILSKGGINTIGSSNTAGLKLEGIMSEGDTLILTNNYQTDGRFGTYTVPTIDSSRTIKLPVITPDNKNWMVTIKNESVDNPTNILTITDSNGAFVYSLKGKIIAKFKLINSIWKKESVTFY